jgi:phytoene dehydrogenase-like protein
MRTAAIIGGGVGGLAAAVRLADSGVRVRLFEASSRLGGLASALEVQGESFDGGPYILLDRPGLEWVYRQLGYDLAQTLTMRRIERIYEVVDPSRPSRVCIFDSAVQTAQGFEDSGILKASTYLRFVERMHAAYSQLAPLQHSSRPNTWKLLAYGAWRQIPFLLKSLHRVFNESEINGPVRDALGIWTHIAGQDLRQAPSPLALIPAIVHSQGCYLPDEGIRKIPLQLAEFARERNVEIDLGARVKKIEVRNDRVTGVKLESGEAIGADAVISNISAIGTYADLVDIGADRLARIKALPLQSPGFCVYLRCRGTPPDFYLRFLLQAQACTVFVCPAAIFGRGGDSSWQARLIRPLRHGSPLELSPEQQRTEIESLLKSDWWRKGIDDFEVLQVRTTLDWTCDFYLYERSMNPVMTAQFMRRGRFPHRSPWLKGLYHAGSSTHPGQWVSFAAISGILAADEVLKDFG